MRKHKIIVIDDEAKILRFVAANLKSLGYDVHAFVRATEALEQLDIISPDLVLLDITMPDLDGFQVLKRIRSFSDVPVIMLTARDNATDKVLGLNSGADDYLTKPFSLEELFARVKAVLRRYDKLPLSSSTSEIQNGPLRLNMAQRRLWINHAEVKLTDTEYKLFSLLMLNMNKVVSHEQLLSTVWGTEYRDEVEYLRVTLVRIRQKLKAAGQDSGFIVNYPGVGYMASAIEE